MAIDFRGKRALVTGGTRGIGAATAKFLRENGASVWITGRKPKGDSAIADHFEYLALDLASEASVESFLSILRESDPFDICVNNAGINIVEDFSNAELDDYRLIQKVNVEGPFRIMQCLLDGMTRMKYGRFVNISSIWGVITRPGRSMYTTSKHGLIGLTKTFAVENAKNNILANCISPGFTRTELTANTNTEEQIRSIENQIPIGRMAETHELAKAIAFLASHENTYITGQNLTVDGGYTIV